MLIVADVLDAATLGDLRGAVEGLAFGDGARTAGAAARAVKANDQALPSAALEQVQARITAALQAHTVLASAARPRRLSPLILSRYRVGQTYGAHVDDALMGGMRTDLSFTLFLSDPETYDGGALVIEDNYEERHVRLAAGDLILYASTTLHRVDPVTRGERLAAVGWIQSWIRDPRQREILFDLDRSIATLFAQAGKTPVHDTLCKTRSNLLRLWAEA